MKTIINKIDKVFILTLCIFVSVSCSDEFFDRPPEDGYSIDGFYANDDQVRASTNHLYTRSWYEYFTNPFYAIGELSSGNGRTWDGATSDFQNFSVLNNNPQVETAWRSLWGEVSQCNAIINGMDNVPASISPAVLNNALGEARFMRAITYFYMVRIWGDLPIIENNLDYVFDPQINKNPVSDVYTFIKNDLKYAIDNCFSKPNADTGKVTKETAQALLAKVYLYEKDYSNAKIMSEKVINSGNYDLFEGSYNELFLTENDNNIESMAALQWSTIGEYGHGNAAQAFFAVSGITGFGSGWSSIGPSIDLQDSYEPGDERKYGTIMERGNFYPNLNGGYTVPDDFDVQGTDAGIKKYVVGNPETNGGGGAMASPNNTYLLRYADVLLIHAEAILAGANSTTNSAALRSVNKVRNRAGLGDITEIFADRLLHERRVEFAFEGEYFFDIQRLDRTEAINMLSNQERGTYSTDAVPVVWSEKFTPTEGDFIFPYPQVDTQRNPLLLEPPVPYDFN
ncbi:RagB/SusD family nutrient uptake outer membrane protein [Thalassobellus citreus]|uniref:RagB/SusD family nutrient uptake outer membrane protein n=1 Tax=Thalassobellus citreus TaxID=3367752 RepID=UPI0037A2F9B2